MHKPLTLGSLFDGSGGFPLGGLLCGIEPLWASEVEPFPIRVTTKRLPQVKHLGDMNKINGATVPPVDIITGGFCCQDLSVAGKRAGLHGERSALFFEMIRIIKEMRQATKNESPKFAVLENVPGMYSSNNGLDFLEVLNELIKSKDKTLSAPLPKDGKWSTAGEIVGDGFSVGWRTLDAQFWGVAQRRRRCFIVVDFTGERAGKILFDESRLRRNPPSCGFPWEATARGASVGFGSTISVLNDQGGSVMSVSENVTATLRSQEHGHPPLVFETGATSKVGGHVWHNAPTDALRAEEMGDSQFAVAIENHPADSRVKIDENGVIQTLTSRMGTGGGNVPLVMNERQHALIIGEDVANTLTSTDYKGAQCVFESKTLKIRSGCARGKGTLVQDNPSVLLCSSNDQTAFVPKAYGICSQASNAMKSAHPTSGIYTAQTSRTLDGNGGNPSCNQGGIAVVSLQGSMIGRKPEHGPQGSGVGEGVSFTLDATDRHAVCYGIDRAAFNQGKNAMYHPQFTEESSSTFTSRGPTAVCSHYIVRRLTPTECALLQGFSPNWCDHLDTPEPTEDDISFWADVFETQRKIIGKSTKGKSRNQIIHWLQNPHSDAAEYKMWGNGVALPCVVFVLSGIAELHRA